MINATANLKIFRVVMACEFDGIPEGTLLRTVEARDEDDAFDVYVKAAMGYRDLGHYQSTTGDPVYFRVHQVDGV